MRVFILSTGRCGSMTFTKACSHIINYTAGHETRARILGKERLKYPDNHIESDNRLSWFLGSLDKEYGNSAFYVHLKRDVLQTAKSYARRKMNRGSILRAYYESIYLGCGSTYLIKDATDEIVLKAAIDYVEKVNDNIENFLKDKHKKLTIDLEEIEKVFPEFWIQIKAEGDLNSALREFGIRYNTFKESVKSPNIYERILIKLNLHKQ